MENSMNRVFVRAMGGLIATSAIAFGSIGVAQADLTAAPMTVSVWTGNGVTDQAALPGPTTTPFVTFSYTGPINFVNLNGQGGSNTFSDFFGSYASNITLTSYNGSAVSTANSNYSTDLNTFLGTTMSTPWNTPGYVNTFMSFTGTYSLSAGDTISITHDDGASLYLNSTSTPYIYAPGPVSSTTTTGQALTSSNSSGSFDLVYVEANGAPAILQVTATPEFHWDSAGAALGLLFGGIVVLRGRRQALGS